MKTSTITPYANLHLHTIHSDGVYSPAQIARIAKEEGYRAIAISDHDTETGYPQLKEACEKEGLECIFAVEFTTRTPIPCHMVAFDFDPEYPPMRKYLDQMAQTQTDNTKRCFDLAVSKGDITGITWDEILSFNQGVKWLCNNHVFNAMMDKGLIKEEEYMNWFDKNFRHQRGEQPTLYPFLSAPELVKLIKDAGGFTVLAHPHNLLDQIDTFLAWGFEGIEVWHPDLTPEESQLALQLALQKDLYISGGSDHSGLCGGYYSSYTTEEELKAAKLYIEPLQMGTTEPYFREMQTRKKNRE